MTTRLLAIVVAALCIATPYRTEAQSFIDALRYSTFEPVGTARAIGTGSTMGAFGADFSVASSNPAGLAWYRKGELTITPAYLNSSVKTTLLSDQSNRERMENSGNFHIPGFGLISVSDPSGPDWRAFNFGIGLNRLKNFNRTVYFQGDSRGSIVDRFLEIANSDAGLSDFEAGLAFDAAAIYDLTQNGIYESDFELAPNALVRRTQTINTTGGINELTFAFAANYKDMLMIGATIGVPFVNFTEEKSYDEIDFSQEIPFFDNLQYFESLRTTGLGLNAKLGFIVRPNQMFRIGGAVHTPTRFRLSDDYYSELTYNYTESGAAQTGYARSPDGSFRYNLSTPWRLIGNAGVLIDKAGFLSFEAEYVNYGKAKLGFRDFPDDELIANENIAARLEPALHLRLGGEVVYQIFRFRAGVGMQQSGALADDALNLSLSAGAGIRGKSVFLDLGYRRTGINETYEPYLSSLAPQQIVDVKTGRDLAVLTLGFRF